MIKNLTTFLISLINSIIILTIISSCQLHPLTVQTQYLSHENLASYHVGTPDPQLDHPSIGQRLFVQWSLTSAEMENQPLFLQLSVRFRNHQDEKLKILIEKKSGYYLYDLTNQDYCETGGILTYMAEIRSENCLIASWKHPLWVPLIQLDVPSP